MSPPWTDATGNPPTVAALWRYPVKSLQGEQLDEAAVGLEGLAGDRQYAIFDVQTGLGVTGRRHPELLFARARLRDDDSLEITLPGGEISQGDADLSSWLGRRVTLRRAHQAGDRRYESPLDFEHEADSTWNAFDGSPGAFHDLAAASVSLLSTATISGWDPRRFRANVLLNTPGGEREDVLVGHEISLGGAGLLVRRRLGRCVMTTRPQPGGIERDLDVLRTINREREGKLAVGATVTIPGRIQVGDPLREVAGAGQS